MSAPTAKEIAEQLREAIHNDAEDGVKGYEHSIEISSHTLVYAEYWIRYTIERLNELK